MRLIFWFVMVPIKCPMPLLMVIVSSLFPPSTSYNTFLVNSQSAPSVGQHFEICTRRVLVVNLTNCRAYPPSSLPPLTYVHPPL
ncbi:uncharacterized protein BKA78DRAFT_314348 [Phyllosticta capitalensis]|uniref:uncharacterized protein n=1 Tax=Phyllosticta capitalensis TaxID=121624 RepID=UPI00312E9026